MEHLLVKVWEEKVIIPTYGVGKPEKNPMFFENRVYQGSSGVVYPNPVIEKIFDEKRDKAYTGLFLENKYLKIMILPELGGRIQMAFDKIKQRHFIYYNQVIKPALVGLTGPWISGGIEFNWPQHHRPSTFEPIDYQIEENADGSKTVWVNEIERMFHTKGMAGFTLYPDSAYIEIKVKLYNRSALPQTFLWWANPAVKVNDHYQSVFPPDVNAVFDHGKRDVSAFPVAKGVYYKVDYAPGTDISMYKNIPVPTSYMAIRSDYDFVGGYEHDTKAGLLHVADHHISPGKKQWTWGNSDFGKAWDRNLTDEDGPYIELMTGVYTDNQPDFAWLMPYETKSFTQYFMPYRELGMVKNATKDILVAVDVKGEKLQLKLYVTSEQKDICVQLEYDDGKMLFETTTIRPESIFQRGVKIPLPYDENKVSVAVYNNAGKMLLKYRPSDNREKELPQPAPEALLPADIASNEQLFLTGQHLEQYRHATYSPVPYYEEALRRDATDLRNNNALGLWYLRRGQFEKGEGYFREAIKTITQHNPNPYDSEPYYNLGLCLKYLNAPDEAYDAFYKAAWSSTWKDSGYLSIAQIDMLRGDYTLALEHANAAIESNANNSKAYVIKAAALRKLERPDEALEACLSALSRDLFNIGALYEKTLIVSMPGWNEGGPEPVDKLIKLPGGPAQPFIEYALDYADAGLYNEAIDLLNLSLSTGDHYPMLYYYLGYFYRLTNKESSIKYLYQAAAADPYLCFPDRLQDINVLQYAIEINSSDAKAPYYLGCLFYDKRQYDKAIKYWELSFNLDAGFSTVCRNLGIAYFNKKKDTQKALAFYEQAFALDKSDARILMELDQLHKRLNTSPQERLDMLETYLDVAGQRDDTYLERVSIYNFLGDHKMALQLLRDRKFHPWEGGEGKVSGQYIYALVQSAQELISRGGFEPAISALEAARVYPYNLGEGKLYGAQENDIFYWLGCAWAGLNEITVAHSFFEKAALGQTVLSAATYYNDQQPDKIFYQGLALKKLGDMEKAKAIFKKLVAHGEAHANDDIKNDYFAVSLPNLLIFDDDLNVRNRVHCLFLQGLGHLGMGEHRKASECFDQVLDTDNMHFGAKSHRERLDGI